MSRVTKLNVWIKQGGFRRDWRSSAIGTWFGHAASRPARHILNYDLRGGMLVQCEVVAVAAEQAGK
jgi:hypothetical protein